MEILFLLSKKHIDALSRKHLLIWWRGEEYFNKLEGNKARKKDFEFIEACLIRFITFARVGDLEGVNDVCDKLEEKIFQIELNNPLSEEGQEQIKKS